MNQEILIVDDEAYIRILLEQTLEDLEEHNVDLLMGTNGLQAVDLADRQHPDVIVMDGLAKPSRRPGGYAAWEELRRSSMVRGRISDPKSSTQRSKRPPSSVGTSSNSREKPATRSPTTLRFLIKDLEKEIKRLTKTKDRLEAKVADLAVSGDHVALTESGAELTTIIAELDAAEEQWLELADEAERASN